ncbi:MAG: nucleotidyltransferase domain-containing protein [Epsilonproteobacteria bacterium]|nr:nucleotidyltransferase domain-containing protein [Campylobacterota bacterium]
MINIKELKPLIIERLKPLNPDKIILFGSYVYVTPNEDSDIDLFLIGDVESHDARDIKVKAKLNLRELMSKYKISFDVLVAPEKFVKSREDYFYKVNILQNGKVWHE